MKLTLTPQILRLIDTALDEDRVGSDYTTLATVPSSVKASARIVARQDLCLAGLSIVQFLFRRFDPQIRFEVSYRDGEWVKAGETIIAVGGLAHALLLVERTALNFLGRLCGVATRSRVW
ncbi:nicotinate-nucleotide diphosphorylase (carboxylating), partial [bacterium]|nr:nicotinate-nucleotide diphosphorylase (carboxylating) [bacterium]